MYVFHYVIYASQLCPDAVDYPAGGAGTAPRTVWRTPHHHRTCHLATEKLEEQAHRWSAR